jgi:hypothetical protein
VQEIDHSLSAKQQNNMQYLLTTTATQAQTVRQRLGCPGRLLLVLGANSGHAQPARTQPEHLPRLLVGRAACCAGLPRPGRCASGAGVLTVRMWWRMVQIAQQEQTQNSAVVQKMTSVQQAAASLGVRLPATHGAASPLKPPHSLH